MIMKHEGGVHGSWFMIHHVVWLIVVSKVLLNFESRGRYEVMR
jgi:hypothetical protein